MAITPPSTLSAVPADQPAFSDNENAIEWAISPIPDEPTTVDAINVFAMFILQSVS
ncbi:MAG: hypothetical protein ACI9WS_001301 [Paraglaciecola psychrophila]|jgi:hypothetical protein